MPVALIPALLVAAVSISPKSVPARGAQEAIIQLDHPAIVRVEASGPGARCELVDHVRGPFASAGTAGKKRCELELLLDGGSYKLRLHSPADGKGKLSLSVREFVELNKTPVRLDEGMADTRDLKPGEQVSYWIHQAARGRLFVRVYGRTAGSVRLWRAGEWLEAAAPEGGPVSPRAGRAINEWWLEPEVEAGDYLLIVDSSHPLRWAHADESNQLHVVAGYDKPTSARASTVDLPAWGSVVYDTSAQAPVFGMLTRLGPSEERATLTLGASAKTDARRPKQTQPDCAIEKKALVPQCAAQAGKDVHGILVARGEPGTPIRLQWGRRETGLMLDGDYTGAATQLYFEPPADGDYLLGVHDVPVDPDSAPLSCQLSTDRTTADGGLVERDFLTVSPKKPFDRAFNYEGGEAVLWLDLTEWGYYTFEAKGERKSRCELFAIEPDGERTRLTDSTKETGCKLKKLLKAGPYELKLYGGTPGIEKLRISGATTPAGEASATKASCLFPSVHLSKSTIYRIDLSRQGALAGRGLVLRRLPLSLEEPLDLNLDAGQELRAPMSGRSGQPLVVRALSGEAKFACGEGAGALAEASGGSCSLRSSGEALVLASRSADAIALSLQLAAEPARPPPPDSYQPVLAKVPELQAGARAFFDFERDSSQSLTFEVREAGLYDVATEGLLSTDCRIRTPTVLDLAENAAGGRGRNCLVQAYLRPGKYLLTVKTTGQSRGRAAVVMTRRPAALAEAVVSGGEVFFRAAAGELIQQELAVKPGRRAKGKKARDGDRLWPVQLETTAQGAQLSCRLDDAEGWPVLRLPASCQGQRELRAGRYLWTQLPLTVESMRHTRLAHVRPPPLLTGDKPHRVALNQPYVARLGKRGHDEFVFTVLAEMDVAVALSSRMQARLYRAEDGAGATPLELIPPDEGAPPPAQAGEAEQAEPAEQADTDAPAVVAPPADAPEGDGPPAEAEGESAPEPEADAPTEGDAPPPPVNRRARQRRRAAVPSPASLASGEGRAVHVAAGTYRLVTEHSRGDVAIRYRILITAGVLAPGMSREVPVPLKATLRMPRAGTLRLHTEGDTDVRCRILDAGGRLLAESSDHGADWNCALAEPLPAGDLTLVLEAETLQPGQTRVFLSLAEEKDAGVLTAAPRSLELREGALSASLPVPAAPAVQQIVVRSDTKFSCALIEGEGTLVERQMDTRLCTLLVRAGEPKPRYRVRLWTLEGKATLSALARELRITSASSERIAGGTAVLATIPRDGRYETGEGVRCIPEGEYGPLAECGPEVSLKQGKAIFAPLDAAEASLPLREQVASIDRERTERWKISRRPFLERQKSAARALQLLRVAVPPGDRAAPACSLGDGVRTQRASTCFAAAGVAAEAVTRLWTAADAVASAEVTWLATLPPARARPLPEGSARLAWEGALGRFALPEGPTRIELTLPASAWAVRTDERGVAVDLCAPSDSARAAALERCVVGGSGGELYLYSPDEPRALSIALHAGEPPPLVALTDRYEERSSVPGEQRLLLKTGGELQIEGAGPLRCVVTLEDGSRSVGCRETVTANATVTVEHAAGPWRAALEGKLFGAADAGDASPLRMAQSEKLAGKLVQRKLQLPAPAVVHVHADSGICQLGSGMTRLHSGLADGCDLYRLEPAGEVVIAVRAFADESLRGSIYWTQEAVQELAEGVGPEAWLEPGSARLFRFQTRTQGGVGLGVRALADELSCSVMDSSRKVLGEGCQQLLQLAAGSYLLAVSAPPGGAPLRFSPVLLGLQGADHGVPDDYLRDLFARIGEEQ